MAQLVKNLPAMQFDPWVGRVPWRRERLSTLVFWPRGFHELYGFAELDTTEQLYSPRGQKELYVTEQLSLGTTYLEASGSKLQAT